MQQINAAYDQIKNPEKYQQQNSGYSGGYSSYDSFGGFGGYGGYQQRGYADTEGADNYQKAAYNYIRFGRYQEALNALSNASQRDARWYYLSALAHDGLGNQVTALEHIRRAVSMEPDNGEYLRTLNAIEYGGSTYRRQTGNYRGFEMRGSPCAGLCLFYLFQMFCCGGRGFFCI